MSPPNPVRRRARSAALAGCALTSLAAAASFAPPAIAAGSTDPATGASAPAPERLRASYSPHDVLVGHPIRVHGRLSPHKGGRTVLLELHTARGWRTVARARTRGDGRFDASWRARALGRLALRVRLAGARPSAAEAEVAGAVTTYRAAQASWYGPGFYGQRLACGGRLRRGQVGVANKHLPCGTRVTFHYRGRTVTAAVIDRGPYVAGREWDLTAALRRRLAFPGTGVIWATR